VAKSGDFRGHQRGPQLAITGYFLVATDTCGIRATCKALREDASLLGEGSRVGIPHGTRGDLPGGGSSAQGT
jgi:hypothetical protein